MTILNGTGNTAAVGIVAIKVKGQPAVNAVASAVTIAKMTTTIATTATIVMVVTAMVTDAVTEKGTGSRPCRLQVDELPYLA